MGGPEYTDVEKPFIDQLVAKGWEYLACSVMIVQPGLPSGHSVLNPAKYSARLQYDSGI